MSKRETLDDQKRKARVNRIKRGIIGVLAFWMIFSLAAIIVLSVISVGLSRRMERLEKSITEWTAEAGRGEKSKAAVQDGKEIPSTEADLSLEPKETEAEQAQADNGIDDEENLAKAGDTHKVYLTFDGGPDENTDGILNVLKHYNVKATFFVHGDESAKMQAVYRRIVADGHTLAMGSYSEGYEMYESRSTFTEDLQKISDFLFRITGLRCKYYRFPGGSGTEVSNVPMTELVSILNDNNLTYFDWNVLADDVSVDSTTEDVVSSVKKGVERYKNSVVLLHEGKGRNTTVEALGTLIETLQEMNAEILPIDDNTYVVQYIKAGSVD